MHDTNDELNDPVNEAIDRNLRDAHEQIRFRPEWVERVLREITSEADRNTIAQARTSVRPNDASGKSWRRLVAMAAGLLLAILGSAWLASTRDREPSTDSKMSVAANQANRSTADVQEIETKSPLDSQEAVEPPNAQSEALSVTTGPGYLASRIANDAKYEIYIVLPTLNITSNSQ